MPDFHAFIQQQVTENDVVLFMKGTADFPQCGFSGLVVQILDYLEVDFKDINVLADAGLREAIKTYSDWPTIPQLYIKGQFIGGSDIVKEMFQTTELQALLTQENISFSNKTQ